MKNKKLINVLELCKHYKIEISFIYSLEEVGLISIISEDKDFFILEEQLSDIEKMMRLNFELEINAQGIDTVFNLLNKINELQEELRIVRQQKDI